MQFLKPGSLRLSVCFAGRTCQRHSHFTFRANGSHDSNASQQCEVTRSMLRGSMSIKPRVTHEHSAVSRNLDPDPNADPDSAPSVASLKLQLRMSRLRLGLWIG